MNIGTAIREIRISRNLKQKQLAKLTGISPTSLSLIENSETLPHSENLKIIADKLNISMDLLYLRAISIDKIISSDDKVIIKAIINKLIHTL